MPIRVFVYGSLKQGRGNHRILAGAKYLGRAYVEGPLKLLSLGGYPGLVSRPDLPEKKIVGEVYQVNEETLQALDWLEGHPRYYERRKIPTEFKNAWAYFIPEEYLEKGYPDAGICWQPTQDELAWMRGAVNND